MSYLILYIVCLASIWWIYKVGWAEALKIIFNILIPSLLIILFNAKAGRLLFSNPLFGVISIVPTAIFIFKASQPLTNGINSWIDNKKNDLVNSEDIIDAEMISKEDA